MRALCIVCVIMLVTVLVMGLLPVHGEAGLYESVVRLHVLAHSDSEADQALKLLVRDRVLETVRGLCEGCGSREETVAALEANLPEICRVATETVRENGADYDVTVTIGEEIYPTKVYEAACFPSGEYVSLRVCIGKAEGQNWWCVLFPPLCLSAASAKEDNEALFLQAGLTPEQYKIVTESGEGAYRIRLKILEVLEGLARNRQ